jgi:DNA gyrase inhibitor GyrI
METLNGGLCAVPAIDGHNAAHRRSFVQRFTEMLPRAPLAIRSKCDPSRKMQHAQFPRIRLMPTLERSRGP